MLSLNLDIVNSYYKITRTIHLPARCHFFTISQLPRPQVGIERIGMHVENQDRPAIKSELIKNPSEIRTRLTQFLE
ncbi:hypothetical protein N9237_01860 [Akkermansiaceae bacterium]|nr:hypothetical protein [Akkermansiaceae bacterium]